MSRTLEEWIALYNKKIPEGFKRDERFELFYLPEKGFVEVADAGTMIIVYQLCGEFKFWRDFVEKLSREFGYTYAGTLVVRNIKPYIRMAGFVPYRIEKTDLGERFFCRDKHTGQRAEVTPVNETTYCVTWEVNANEE